MRWEDERYVRLYTRDTVDWEMMPWQSRALFPLLLRKVDRAGILQLGKHGKRGLAHVVGMPVEVVEAGLAGLLEDGSVELHGDTLIIRNFIEAQEAKQSDAQRKRDSRERHRVSVTNRDGRSQNVTESHTRSRAVTDGHSVPSLAVPSRTEPNTESAGDGQLALTPVLDLGKAESQRQRKVVDRFLSVALPIFHALNEARKRVIPGARDLRPTYSSLDGICSLLDAGKTAAECLTVVEVCEREVRADARSAQWFDQVTPWRPKNFERKLAADAVKNIAPGVTPIRGALPLSTSVTDETRAKRKW